MIRFILVLGFFFISSHALCAPQKDNTLFRSAKRDIERVLSNKIFFKYRDFNIVNIRQGEVGEAMTYFVTLEKPFQSATVKTCFMFQSSEHNKWEPVGAAGDCKD